MKINQFSKETGLSPRAIRLYEEKGILKSQREPGNKYRIYSPNQIPVGQNINRLRQLGFTLRDIANLLLVSPNLKVSDLNDNVHAHLARLKYQVDETKMKISETEKLLHALEVEKPLTKKQTRFFEGFSHAVLRKSAISYTHAYLKRKKLGHDEELQMVAGAYAHLFLMAAAQGRVEEFAKSHSLIAKCLKNIGEIHLADRHLKLANAYTKMKF